MNTFLMLICSTIMLSSGVSDAATFALPPVGEQIIGELKAVRASRDETLLDIALRNDVGYEAIVAANPEIDPWLPEEGAWVTVPTQFILPDTAWEGIVINLPEMRLYYYPKPKPGEQAMVITYPISIGSEGRNLPIGMSQISEKKVNPAWLVPESIRAEHAGEGEILPAVVPPGPDNPLGKYSMRLGNSSYLIHGTNKSFSIGMRVSHGCIRMYPEDIEALFPLVPSGTPVRIINQPFKAGWRDDELYIEAHAPLREKKFAPNSSHFTEMVAAVIGASDIILDEMSWEMSQLVAEQYQGIPTKILPTKAGESLLRTTATLRPDLIPGDTWWLQLGAYYNLHNAKLIAERIGRLPADISTNLVTNGRLCHLIIGPFAARDAAVRMGKIIRTQTDFSAFPVSGSNFNGYRYCHPDT